PPIVLRISTHQRQTHSTLIAARVGITVAAHGRRPGVRSQLYGKRNRWSLCIVGIHLAVLLEATQGAPRVGPAAEVGLRAVVLHPVYIPTELERMGPLGKNEIVIALEGVIS